MLHIPFVLLCLFRPVNSIRGACAGSSIASCRNGVTETSPALRLQTPHYSVNTISFWNAPRMRALSSQQLSKLAVCETDVEWGFPDIRRLLMLYCLRAYRFRKGLKDFKKISVRNIPTIYVQTRVSCKSKKIRITYLLVTSSTYQLVILGVGTICV